MFGQNTEMKASINLPPKSLTVLPMKTLNAHDFLELTGSHPEDDDLERSNCPDAGKPGHLQCGICPTCKLPRFMCHTPSTCEPHRIFSA